MRNSSSDAAKAFPRSTSQAARNFGGSEFVEVVRPGVLIPRPETERRHRVLRSIVSVRGEPSNCEL